MNEIFSRWNLLLVVYLKRDYKKIIFWILGLGLFSAGFVPAFKELAKGQGAFGMYETLKNPAMIAMVGPTPVTDAKDYTIGAMYAHEMLLFCGLFAMIIAALHVIGHTRKEEDLGLTELIRSFQVGRQANSFAVIVEVLLIHFIMGLFISVMMISFGVDSITMHGSLLFGASIALAGMIGALLALLLAQIMPSSSAATASTLGVIGLLYIFRASTDVTNIDFSMLNPFGWTYLTYPFTENNWLPIFYGVIFCFAILWIAFILEGKRDMGAGYLREREGRARANQSLLSFHGLSFRINRGVIIAWLLGFSILGASYGSIYGDMQTFLSSNELIQQMLIKSPVSMEASFTSTIIVVMIYLVAVLPVVLMNKLFAEEKQRRFSQLFTTKVTRGRIYWTTIVLAIFAGLAGIFFASIGLGGTAIIAMGEQATMKLGDFFAAGYNLLPTVLIFTALAGLFLGWAPGYGKVVYLYLVYSFVLNYFARLLNFPDYLLKTTTQYWLPEMPLEAFNLTAFILLSLISFALMYLGYLGYKSRDLLEEG